MGILEKIAEIEKEISRTQKNKGVREGELSRGKLLATPRANLQPAVGVCVRYQCNVTLYHSMREARKYLKHDDSDYNQESSSPLCFLSLVTFSFA